MQVIVPILPRRLVSDDEIAGVFGEAQSRFKQGREKYQGSWAEADLKTDLIEECLDLMNYAAYIILRIRQTMPDFEGLTSNELVP